MISFRVYGAPVAQGSKRLFTVGGQARMKESSAGHAPWRNEVSKAALAAKEAAGLTEPLDGPLHLTAVFRFPMPKSRPAALRKAGVAYKTTAPDLSKLIRSVEDSLQAAGLITDDARIASFDGSMKLEVLDQWTGVDLTVRSAGELVMPATTPPPRRLKRQ